MLTRPQALRQPVIDAARCGVPLRAAGALTRDALRAALAVYECATCGMHFSRKDALSRCVRAIYGRPALTVRHSHLRKQENGRTIAQNEALLTAAAGGTDGDDLEALLLAVGVDGDEQDEGVVPGDGEPDPEPDLEEDADPVARFFAHHSKPMPQPVVDAQSVAGEGSDADADGSPDQEPGHSAFI